MPHAWFWIGLFLLGCYHGINPGMGWLFAVALALQEKSRKAIYFALPPIALGHVISVLAIVALAALIQLAFSAEFLRVASAGFLIAFGIYRAVRARHFRWVGMRVGFWGLALWSFLMATGHGAGLMLLPFLTHGPGGNLHLMSMSGMPGTAVATTVPFGLWLAAVGVHTFGYLVVMTIVAFIIYSVIGVHILRTAWLNFDLVWAVALVLSGIFMLVL